MQSLLTFKQDSPCAHVSTLLALIITNVWTTLWYHFVSFLFSHLKYMIRVNFMGGEIYLRKAVKKKYEHPYLTVLGTT